MTTADLLNHLAADPWKALAAGMLERAVRDAQRGDDEALGWLSSPPARRYLDLISPSNVDVEVVHRKLLRKAKEYPA